MRTFAAFLPFIEKFFAFFYLAEKIPPAVISLIIGVKRGKSFGTGEERKNVKMELGVSGERVVGFQAVCVFARVKTTSYRRTRRHSEKLKMNSTL